MSAMLHSSFNQRPNVRVLKASHLCVFSLESSTRLPFKSILTTKLPQDIQAEFYSLMKESDSVFDPNFKGYNGAAGPFQAKVNMGPVEPPQRKGRLPQNDRGKLVLLQEKFDELEELGVFKTPEKANTTVEYLNPSFLVRKSNGGHLLVTAFAATVSRSLPSFLTLTPPCDTLPSGSTLSRQT